jgi:hypothetical protein
MATANKKLGFGGQWVDLFKAGVHTGKDDNGDPIQIPVTTAFLETVAGNYDPSVHEAPACIGHPETDAPAYGWVAGLRVENGMLQAQFADTDPGFEQIVSDGRYKKRSPKFYLTEQACGKAPYLRHVAWLGAQPPAVKGMRDVQRHAQFSEDEGKTVAFEIEFSEGDEMTTQNKVDDQQVENAVLKFLKDKLGIGKKDEAASASFSEADAKTLVENAITAAVKPLNDKITSLETENKDLKTQVAGIGTSTSRAELISFCEALEQGPNATLPRAFRSMGGAEFLEVLASLPAEKKITTIEFAEENGKRVEKKADVAPLDFMKNFLKAIRYVQFGEAFADVRAIGNGKDVLDPQYVQDKTTLREAMGVKTEAAK